MMRVSSCQLPYARVQLECAERVCLQATPVRERVEIPSATRWTAVDKDLSKLENIYSMVERLAPGFDMNSVFEYIDARWGQALVEAASYLGSSAPGKRDFRVRRKSVPAGISAATARRLM